MQVQPALSCSFFWPNPKVRVDVSDLAANFNDYFWPRCGFVERRSKAMLLAAE
jgi:hypothetical protein